MDRPDSGIDPDPDPHSDDRLADLLGAYDDAAGGGDAPPLPRDADVPSGLRSRWVSARAVVDGLRHFFPGPGSGRSASGVDPDRPTAEMDRPGSPAPEVGPVFRLDGFQILEEVGRGGMGVVYRAIQTRLSRDVAIKTLPPHFATDRDRLRRFRNEARMAAALADSHILPVFDVLETDHGPLIVMPFVEGHDLARIISDRRAALAGDPPGLRPRHPWAELGEAEFVREVLGVLDCVVHAVAVLHGKGVLHRDVKPSNILVAAGGQVWLTDFGLAKAIEAVSTLTATGAQLGSPGYMSPEQWAGGDTLDTRVDVFGLGSTIYQALTLRLPYGTARIDARTPLAVPPRRYQAELRADFDAVILGGLEPGVAERYASAAEFRDDWFRVRRGLSPRKRPVGWAGRASRRVRNHRWGVSDALMAVLIVALLGLAWNRAAVPNAGRGGFAVVGGSGAAPPSGVFAAPKPALRPVLVTTEPAGARVALVPIDTETGDPDPARAFRPVGTTPLTVPAVPPGDYLVVAEVARFGWFHEVVRHVPADGESVRVTRYTGAGVMAPPSASWADRADGVLLMPTIRIPKGFDAAGMARFDGSSGFPMGDPDPRVGLSQHPVRVDPFLLDAVEVSVGSHQDVMGGVPEPLTKSRRNLSRDLPVVMITFDQALAYAERVGKRLPTEEELEFAATSGGTRRFPWGDSDDPIRAGESWSWPFGAVGQANPRDRTGDDPAVLGLFSNVAEWTSSWNKPYPMPFLPPGFKPAKPPGYSDLRVVKGSVPGVIEGTGPEPDLKGFVVSPHWRASQAKDAPAPGLGFRCARSVTPRFLDGP